MKKLISTLLSLTLIFALSVPAFAAEQTDSTSTAPAITVDLDNIDLTKPYSDTTVVYTDENTPVTLTMEFTPAPQTRGSSTNSASVGTWTSHYNDPISSMSYDFDLEKSGSQWKMTNARNHSYSGILMSFSNPSLKISRSVSTNTFPCEINSSVFVTIFDNQWITIGETTWSLKTQVTSGGSMTLYW